MAQFLELEELRHATVGDLSYGLRKRVDLGRAIALDPKILIMDEPMAGMNPEEKGDLARFVLDIREARKIPIVLVEHDMEVVMDISDTVTVLGNLIGSSGYPHDAFATLAAYAAPLALVEIYQRASGRLEILNTGPFLVRYAAALSVLLAIIAFSARGGRQFIYFDF